MHRHSLYIVIVLNRRSCGEKISLANKLFPKVTDYSTTIIIFNENDRYLD